MSLAAGLAEMALSKFLLFTVIGCVAWCAVLTGVGYSLGSSYKHVLKDFSYAGYVVAALVIVAVAGLLVHRVREVRAQNRDALLTGETEPEPSEA